MIEEILGVLGITASVSSDVQFAIGTGCLFIFFCVFIVGFSAMIGRWFK